MMRRVISAVVRGTLAGMRRTRPGRFVYQQVLQSITGATRTVAHGSVTLELATPNWIADYRADTFLTKEPETLRWLAQLPQASILWDVGANVGLYATYAAVARECRVFAFEPSVFNLELLARNVFLNRVQERVVIVPVPLNDAKGTSLFQMSTTDWAGALSTFSHGIDQDGLALRSVFQYSLLGLPMDEARDHLGVPQPYAIKMDVDGIEHFILAGGPGVLRAVTEVLIEINDGFVEQAQGAERLLRAAGLTLVEKQDAGAPGVFNQWWRRER